MSDAPIEPQDYLYGLKVVQIEDLRVSRGLTRRPSSSCRHKALVYDDKERRIWCSDCESEIEPFDAFIGLCGVFSAGMKDLKSRRRKMDEAEAFQLRGREAAQHSALLPKLQCRASARRLCERNPVDPLRRI